MSVDANCLWALEPICPAEDPLWQDRVIWSRVIVCARSAAFARMIAEEWASRGAHEGPGNESFAGVAGFREERLYSVTRIRQEDMPSGDMLNEGIVSAERAG